MGDDFHLEYLKIKEFRNYKNFILLYIYIYKMSLKLVAEAPQLPKRWADYTEDDPLPNIPWLKEYCKTNIINPKMKVFSLSDIHGDIQSFVIALRDLAGEVGGEGVIRKKKAPTPINPIPNFETVKAEKDFNSKHYTDFSNNKYDDNMEYILNLDLNTDEDIYTADLNYEWCGGNTHVVICGDIIDPQRKKTCLKKDKNTPCAYYPQIELKLLMFINALNDLARPMGGNIVKLLGNHDLAAIIYPSVYSPYIYKKDIELENNYYNGNKRLDIFKVGKPGFNLLVKGACRILIKINNTIFVHGDLLQTYKYYNDLNQFINNPNYHTDTERNHEMWKTQFTTEYQSFTLFDNNKKLYEIGAYYYKQRKILSQQIFDQIILQKELDKIMSREELNEYHKLLEHQKYLENLSPLLSRMRGNDELSSARAKLSFVDDNRETDKFCNNLISSFTKFASSNPEIIKENVNDLKLVIGHCTQHDISTIEGFSGNGYNVTYDTKIGEDSVKEVFGDNIFRGEVNFNDRGKIFGITMECQIPEQPQLSRLYRVDTGVSRDNDDPNVSDNRYLPKIIYSHITTVQQENQFLYSRTPQILKINEDGKFFIIKSKMIHTRRHLPRPNYEEHALKIPELQLDIEKNKHYEQKYLKYKNKYLQLKQIIN
jgi:hypothetical protein